MIKVATLVNVFAPARPQFNAVKRTAVLEKESRPLLAYALIAVNAALLLSYLLGVNARASTGYEIKQLNNRIQLLNEEQKDLNLKLSEATAVSVMSEDFAREGFIQAGSSQYVTVDAPTGTAMK
jgi:hypothetical protein